MMKTTFSNGHVDVYKGKRPVTVGWMITMPSGKFFTGHSLDEKKARATAFGVVRYSDGAPMHVDKPAGRATAAAHAYYHKQALAAGFRDARSHYADYQTKIAAYRAQCKIEIVPVTP